MSDKNRIFQKFALSSTVATYFLIFIGGLVRVSGAGLGCPDWPKCFGRWIPPLSRNEIPQGFDTASFNVTLAWIEYLNRLAGMITGLLILITAILAIIHFRKQKMILIPSILAAVIVAFQGWYGSIVVKSQLLPLTVTIHMLIALVIVSLLIYVTYRSFNLGRPLAGPETRSHRLLLLILWIITIIQILFGTDIRSQIEIIWDQFPLLSAGAVLARVGLINPIHAILGIFVAIGTILIGLRVLKMKNLSEILKQGIWLMITLVVLQIVVGLILQLIGLPPILQVFHLWMASLFIGIILMIYTELTYQQV